MSAPPADQEALLAGLRSLPERLPVPDGSWHAWVPEIRGCRDGLRLALRACEADPRAGELLAAALDGSLDEPFAGSPGTALEAHYRLLGSLPLPGGRHPYLDEILAALEATEAALVAVSLVPAAARTFAAAAGSDSQRARA